MIGQFDAVDGLKWSHVPLPASYFVDFLLFSPPRSTMKPSFVIMILEYLVRIPAWISANASHLKPFAEH
jgi:hypothetical protein